MRTLVVFEDPQERAFSTLTALRAVFDLRCGARTLLERMIDAVAPHRLGVLVRSDVAALVAEAHGEATDAPALLPPGSYGDGDVVFVNGRLLALGRDLQRLLDADAGAFVAMSGGAVLAARCPAALAPRLVAALPITRPAAAGEAMSTGTDWRARLARDVPELGVHDVASRRDWNRDGSLLVEHVWQLVESNGKALDDDFRQRGGAWVAPSARLDAGVHILQPEAVRVEADVRLRPGVVLDAEAGPITIAAGADVHPQVVIRGPVFVGPRCLLKAGTKIQGHTSLGPVCKMGGEIADTIVQGYSNKQHEGFLGHAYLAEWVNLGADTNNSDLKNNYGPIRMWEAGAFVDTGLLFAGLVAADHVRSAINTQFNTGTVVGLGSQIAVPGFPPKYIPPFSWCGPEGIVAYDIERAVQTARTVMARRDRTLTPAYEAALRRVFASREHCG